MKAIKSKLKPEEIDFKAMWKGFWKILFGRNDKTKKRILNILSQGYILTCQEVCEKLGGNAKHSRVRRYLWELHNEDKVEIEDHFEGLNKKIYRKRLRYRIRQI